MIESEIFTAKRQCDFYDFVILWCICSIILIQILFKFCLHGNACSSKVVSASRQSPGLFLQSSELGLPHPLTRRRECLTPLWLGGGGGIPTRWGERGWGIPIPTRGQTLYFSFLCTLWRYPLRMGMGKIVASFLMGSHT